jgi:hypothetical protein
MKILSGKSPTRTTVVVDYTTVYSTSSYYWLKLVAENANLQQMF